MRFSIFILVAGVITACSNERAQTGMEALAFDVTGSSKAMPAFQKGLLLLHNFEYMDAAEAFIEAQQLDSTFAMAYWGEAMTYNHPVWRQQNTEKGRATLNRLGLNEASRLNKAKTQLEKDFISSINVLYGEGTKPSRDKAYGDYMKNLYEKYPGNNEVASFYALSLLGQQDGWNKELSEEGAKVSQGILKSNPRHPGALHYLIHSDDHPEYARYALKAANEYSGVASYAGHALHMPSHIYLALGMWDEVVRANIVSWQAGVDRKVRKNLSNDELNYHGYLWLEYAYLQKGEYDSARQILENQCQFMRERPSSRSIMHFVLMRAHYLVETGNWQLEVFQDIGDIKSVGIQIRAADQFTNGLKAFLQKDKASLKILIGNLLTDINQSAKSRLLADGVTVCGVGTGIPTDYEIDVATIMSLELLGLSAWLDNDLAGAEGWFQKATAAEDAAGYFYGPPDVIKPSHELYGEFLTRTNKPDQAREEFAKALRKAPGRRLSLSGKS